MSWKPSRGACFATRDKVQEVFDRVCNALVIYLDLYNATEDIELLVLSGFHRSKSGKTMGNFSGTLITNQLLNFSDSVRRVASESQQMAAGWPTTDETPYVEGQTSWITENAEDRLSPMEYIDCRSMYLRSIRMV